MNSKAEKLLPADYQFEEVTKLCGDVINLWLEGVKREWSDVINPGTELERDFRLFFTLAITFAAGILGDEWDEYEDKSLVVNSIYRGMIFGVQLADMMEVCPVQCLEIGKFLEEGESMEFSQYLIDSVGEYLSERPAIDGLVGRYMPELDETNRCNHYVEIGAGLMLLLSECAYGENYFKDAINNIDPNTFNNLN